MATNNVRYITTEDLEKALQAIFCSGPVLSEILESLGKESKTAIEIYEELEELLTIISEAHLKLLYPSILNFTSLIPFLEEKRTNESRNDSSAIANIKAAILSFLASIQASPETLAMIETALTEADSRVLLNDSVKRLEELIDTFNQVIATVKDALREWKKEREEIIAEIYEIGEEDIGGTAKLLVGRKINALNDLLERLALDGIIDPRFANIEALPSDTRSFIKGEILK